MKMLIALLIATTLSAQEVEIENGIVINEDFKVYEALSAPRIIENDDSYEKIVGRLSCSIPKVASEVEESAAVPKCRKIGYGELDSELLYESLDVAEETGTFKVVVVREQKSSLPYFIHGVRFVRTGSKSYIGTFDFSSKKKVGNLNCYKGRWIKSMYHCNFYESN